MAFSRGLRHALGRSRALRRLLFLLDTVIASIDLAPSSTTVTIDNPTTSLTATARNAAAQVITGATVYYRSSDTRIVTVGRTSPVVTQVGAGTATIIARSVDTTATHLVFTTHPVGGVSGAVLPTQPVVAAWDTLNTTDTAYTGTVVFSLNVVSGTPSLGGTTSVPLVNGSAAATNLTVTGSGTWTLTASLAPLTAATSVQAATNSAPATPTLSAPSSITSSGATFTGSAFSDPDGGDTHAASQWQVTTSADTGYATPVISTGDDTTHKTSYTASGLSASTPYIARVRYKDSAGNYSAYSSNASFTTAAAGPTTLRSDTFDRADNTTSIGAPSDGGAAYIGSNGTFGIIGNQAYVTVVPQGAARVLEAGTADCTVSVTLAHYDPAGSGDAPGIAFRADAGVSNFWLLRPVYPGFWLDKFVAGSPTNVAQSTGVTYADGDVLSVDLSADSIICKLNGVALTNLSISDTTYDTNTKHGLGISGGTSTTRWENLAITSLANQPPATPTLTPGTPTSTGVTLTGSAFSDADVGDTHAATQWQVTAAADTAFASPVRNTGDDATNKTSYAVTGLAASTPYIARARYKDSAGSYSRWSSAASFTTAAAASVSAQPFDEQWASNSIRAAAWTTTLSGTAAASATTGDLVLSLTAGGRGDVATPGSEGTLYDLTTAGALTNGVVFDVQFSGGGIANLVVADSTGAGFGFEYYGPGVVLYGSDFLAGSGSLDSRFGSGGAIAYDSTAMRYLRIRKNGTNMEMHFSNDGAAWTLRQSSAIGSVNVTAMSVVCEVFSGSGAVTMTLNRVTVN